MSTGATGALSAAGDLTGAGPAAAPFVVVSVVNWNTAALTLRCLQALQALDHPRRTIVVVDNGSRDDSVALIAARHPDVVLLRSDANLGYAAGHALALQHAQRCGAAAVWLVNSDAEVEADALTRLVEAWQVHGDALYGGVPLASDGAGIRLNFPAKYLDVAGAPHAWRRDAAIDYDDAWCDMPPRRVGAVPGSCLFVPLAVVERHGWLDPAWFMYCEEIDYCYRLRARGVPSWLVPRARVWHAGGGSLRGVAVDDCIQYYRTRNEIALAFRHAGRWTGTLTALKKIARAAQSWTVRAGRGRMVLRGALDALRGVDGRTLLPDDYVDAPAPSLAADLVRERIVRGLERLFDRGRVRIERIGPARIAYACRAPPYIREYQRYCIALLRMPLMVHRAPLNVSVGDVDAAFGHVQRAVRIGLQLEHTLVKPGGRDSAGAPAGQVPLPDGSGRYLVRLEHYERLRACDAVIEYSRPNMANVAGCPQYADYAHCTVQIAPLLYPLDASAAGRDLHAVTLFADPGQPRRRALLQQAGARGMPLRNVRGIFGGDALRRLYRRTRILVNVRQTDQHDTLEELRVLPALLCGVIVVSEDVPLREHVPYADFIVWSGIDGILDTVCAVEADYAAWHARIFGDPKLPAVLAQMRLDNEAAAERAVSLLL